MGRIRSLAGLPIEQHSSPNVDGAMDDHRGIVLHIAEGSYEGTISWQLNPNQTYASGGKVTTSSTWIVGKNHGEWAQMSDSNTVAWCQRAGSRTWNSIELAGHAGDKPTAWQVEACAQLLAWVHKTHGVPLAVADTDAERGLGHHSMDREWAGVEWGHDDCPGAGVIAAKPAIVARAKQIIMEGEDMPLTEADEPIIGDGMHKALHSREIGRTGVTYAEVFDGMRLVPGKLDAVLAAVLNVDEEVLAKLGDAEQTPEQIAAILRPLLGDQAAAVGHLLAA